MSDNLPPLPETTWMLWLLSAYEDPYCSYSEGYTEGDMLAYATAAVDAAVAAERERWADEIENRRVEIRQRAIDYLALDTEARALQDEVERLRADLGVLCIQRDDLMAMLRRVLDAGNAEAKAAMSYENASNNFSSSADEWRQYERAMNDASESERAARVLLMTLRVETVDAIIRGEQK
jgi:hypothetical protein